ncbi:MAG: squalene--hopene cyclase [Thermoleophilia bacterium]|nr:squalene--hopene cyclase [Thermoleophilia bacterium]
MNSRSFTAPELRGAARLAADRGAQHLRGLQHDDGFWWGELESNASITAEHLFLLEALGMAGETERRAVAAELLATQGEDGGWPIWHGAPGDLSITVEAWYALRLAGIPESAEPMQRAERRILALGGANKARFFTRLWLAVLGQYPWRALPAAPPEIVMLPARAPVSVYRFASWARGTFVPMLVVLSRNPTFPQAASVAPIFAEAPGSVPGPDPRSPGPLTQWISRLMPLAHWYNRHPLGFVRRLSERRIRRWILDRQEADGAWAGIQPPWVYSIFALHALGMPLDHPVITRAIEGFSTFLLYRDGRLRMQSCLSPVWDTALAAIAIDDAGTAGDDDAVSRARDWLLAREVTREGDWRNLPRRGEAGGWSFEFNNEWYPDTDDTAEVLIALLRTGVARSDGAVRRGVKWLLSMQSRDGGWAAFDVDNTSTLIGQFPVCDFGEVIDPSTEDVTAHVLEALAECGVPHGHPAIRTGLAYLRRTQRQDGSWWGRWGVNHVYGTGAVLPALAVCGVDMHASWVLRGVDWLARHQNADGGWGEDIASYRDPSLAGVGESTASQTAWALIGLIAAAPDHPAISPGIAWLVDSQGPNGDWDEDAFTGTGFPGDFMIKYHYYRLYFPVMALGRYAG